MDKTSSKWEKPKERQDDRETGYDFGVNEAFLVPVADISDRVEVLACDADNNCCKGELGL